MCYGFEIKFSYYYRQARKIWCLYMSESPKATLPSTPTRKEIRSTNRILLEKLLAMVEKLEGDVEHIKEQIKAPIATEEIFEDSEDEVIVSPSWLSWS
tara:strand:+ start:216 stop:509 length:294 start_codon:yes stop_codon:yes gene_type:complete